MLVNVGDIPFEQVSMMMFGIFIWSIRFVYVDVIIQYLQCFLLCL